jgi:arrestin-related trafficking adapter 1
MLPRRRGSNEKPKPSKRDLITALKPEKKNAGNEPFELGISIESPPLIAYGRPENSTGALFSALLEIHPRPISNAVAADKTFDIGKLEVSLVMETTMRLPIVQNCPACTTQAKVLKRWVFSQNRMTLAYNTGGIPHRFPFSFLLPGTLPPTTRCTLASISYKLVAESHPYNAEPDSPTPSAFGPARPGSPKQKFVKPITLQLPINLARSIHPSLDPVVTNKVFPPTTLQAHCRLPSVIHPGSIENELNITLSGVNSAPGVRWQPKQISWRIDEIARVFSPACPAHTMKLNNGEGKGLLYNDTRTVGEGESKGGWTRNKMTGDMECELHIGTFPRALASCHVESKCGINISHQLGVEFMVTEEISKGGSEFHATVKSRVLRMTFPLDVTDRGGMGISWDEEIPPRYEDVAWNAPPSFSQIEGPVDAGSPESIEGIELDRFNTMIGNLSRVESGSSGSSM